eukprot:1945401-Amphidinium_carterae.1
MVQAVHMLRFHEFWTGNASLDQAVSRTATRRRTGFCTDGQDKNTAKLTKKMADASKAGEPKEEVGWDAAINGEPSKRQQQDLQFTTCAHQAS